jgi:hypothetical protein
MDECCHSCTATAEPDAHFNSSTEQMMMVILGNDLANVIQAERRREAARELLLRDSVTTARNLEPWFTLNRLGAVWLRVRMADPATGVQSAPPAEPHRRSRLSDDARSTRIRPAQAPRWGQAETEFWSR